MAKKVKAKTNRSAAKRFHFTASGKLKRKKAGLRHFMRRRPTKAKRNLRQRGYIDSSDLPRVLPLLPNR